MAGHFGSWFVVLVANFTFILLNFSRIEVNSTYLPGRPAFLSESGIKNGFEVSLHFNCKQMTKMDVSGLE